MQYAKTNKKQMGIIDTFTAGFEMVNRALWVMIVPVLVDLLLWRGPHITPAPLFQRLLVWYQASLAPAAEFLAPSGQRIEDIRQTLEAVAASYNMLSLLVLNFIANVPTTTGGRAADTTLVVTISSEGAFAILFVLLELTGLLLGCIYFGLIAQQVREGQTDLADLSAKLWSYFAAMLVLGLIYIGAIVALALPTTLLVAGSRMVGAGATNFAVGLAGTVAYFLAMWSLIFLFFATDAVVVSEVRAPRAILNSVLVVGKNFWSTLALIALTFLILAGTQVIWNSLSGSTLGVVVGIAGNAYIASGLTAAGMLFYKSRLAGLEENGIEKRFLRR